MTLPPSLTRRLERTVREVQRTARIPAVCAGIMRDGELVWSLGVGAGDVDAPDDAPTVDTAFAVGSISKTFTAALVMMLRDEGKLSLSDRLIDHIPGHRHTSITLRELMSHASGLQREPNGEPWDTMEMPSIDEVVATLDEAEQVLPARRRWHYSNLAYALLGEVVARVDGRPMPEALTVRILEPLGLSRTSFDPGPPRARGYFTDPYVDQVRIEAWPRMGAFTAAGGLWSTVADLARWAAMLSDGNDSVLPAATVDEMTRPEIMADLGSWNAAAGLGLQLFRSGDRVLVGHAGAMPGFLAGLLVRRSDRTGAVVLTNNGAGADPVTLAIDLVNAVLDDDPKPAAPWRPGPPVPPELLALVGRWWSEGVSFAFTVRDAKLEARADEAPASRPPTIFRPDGEDCFRADSGPEEGELLRVERTDDGGIGRLVWGGYPFTREPRVFGPSA